jgi:hypothetical protein
MRFYSSSLNQYEAVFFLHMSITILLRATIIGRLATHCV